MTLNVFDFIHDVDAENYDFDHSVFKIRIRLLKDWKEIFERTHLAVDCFGDWEAEPYNIEKSTRLIMVARRES